MPGTGLWRTKTVEQSIKDTDEPDTKLRKNLGAWDLMVFGVSVVIGAGIFTLAASTAGDVTGPSVSLSFVFAAIACGLAAVCYAEFASTVPVAGSAYTYSYATFGEFIAWIIGWDLILEFAVAAAAVSKGWSSYLQQVLQLIGINGVPTKFELGPLQFDWGALLLIAGLTAVLALGTKLSARVSLVISALKVFVVLLVVVVGLSYINPSNYTPFIPPAESGAEDASKLDQSLLSLLLGGETSSFGVFGLLAGASLVFFAFIGFDVVATTAEETRNPQRDAPRGIFGSLAIVTVLYVAVAVVVTGMVNFKDLATVNGEKATLATAFQLNGVTWAAGVITVGALAGLTTVVMVMFLGQVRILFAMSRDGLLPRGLAKTHEEHGTPVRATLLVGGIVALAAAFFPADKLEEMVNVGTLFAFILVSAGVIILRRSRPDLPRGFRAPLVPLVPILAIIACLWLMLNLTALTWVRFIVWMIAGVVVYFLYSRKHSRLGQQQREVAAGGSV
ncbi:MULTISPECIES: amino acid permease [unclassified Saccharopolyspora]|uniref:amino acid permease n=1 Tax=unclassified Saccharopolyspora TaxID=2646250 RepID=UPI001CD360E6|nr:MULTISPECIES: amino acid permease [unclassified Saccharopolyspora]MCA1188697.1 amino acid permease [Saccharopolyspora sp. 6T]MCA1195035.1 amino acid permease [Saccharopolyspora sp. 6V]MCA1227684.1 amino acid permease [Saccharopolyspora sp. 6M]MCA1279238.1 amino acid permease [Saccharopolyspora sp. 7B]